MGGDLRLALVGCGRIAIRGYVPAIAQTPRMTLTAVVDSVLERCRQAAPGVPAFTSVAELLAGGSVDALVLATPAEAHADDARRAASARLPTLIEKPPAPTYAETVALTQLDPAPRFAFNRRFVPAIAALRFERPSESPILIELELSTRSASWASYVSDDDALLNLGPHLIDLARWLSSNEIVGVRATVAPSRAELELELAGGRGQARVRCASDRRYRERVRVSDAHGPVAGEYTTGGLSSAARFWLGGAGRHPLVPSLARQLEAFGQAVRNEPAPALATGLDAVAVMATIEAARLSAARGGTPVELPLAER